MMTTITDDTPATLAQHKVRAGDVVLYVGEYATSLNKPQEIVGPHENGGFYSTTLTWGGNVSLKNDGPWTVLSRATPAQLPHGHVRLSDGRVVDLTADKMLPFGQLDAETQKAMRAHGGPYQMYRDAGWRQNPIPSFVPDMAYRVAPIPPAPKVETVAREAYLADAGWLYQSNLDDTLTHVTVTFKRIDGKADPASFKLEARP